MKPYPTSFDHLNHWLQWLDQKLQNELEQQPQDDGGTSNLFISGDEISRLVHKREQPRSQSQENMAMAEHLERQIDQRVLLTRKKNPTALLSLEYLCRRFRLSRDEEKILLIALAPEVSPHYGKIYAYIQDDMTAKLPTVNLVLQLLGGDGPERYTYRRYFAESSPIIYHRLVHKVPQTGQLLANTPLKIEEKVADFLLAPSTLTSFSPLAKVERPENTFHELLLSPELIDDLSKLVHLDDPPPVIHFRGPSSVGKREAARALAGEMGRPVVEVETSNLPPDRTTFSELLRAIHREVILQNGILVLTHIDTILFNPGVDDFFRNMLERLLGQAEFPVIMTGMVNRRIRLREKVILEYNFVPPPVDLRKQEWSQLMDLSPEIEDYLSSTFALSGPQIREAIRRAEVEANLRQTKLADLEHEDLKRACLSQATHNLSDLASQISPFYEFEDLVLPDDCKDQLSELTLHIEFKHKIYAQWGFDTKYQDTCLAALFVGQSGTGKTMSAQVIAGLVGLDLFRVDLSRIVSKFIGETEKNLSKIFDEAERSHCILFFDEADALFGKRSEVESSHDRYANIETDYLLQRIEHFHGVIILATNFQENIDEAFLRRMRFLVEFPFPEAEQRLAMWKKVFPENAPLAEDVDFAFLAEQFPISGGNIRNIALNAAFLAAHEKHIAMEHVVLASRREYDKIGRRVTERDFGKYFELLGLED